jgi:hypothetical protein
MSYARSTLSGIVVIALLAGLVTFVTPISTATAGAVDSCGYSCQNIGTRPEEYDSETSMYGNCFGACGPGCNYTCGGGGACTRHDRAMRKHGLWSWQQFDSFPAAAVQWGSCVTGRGIDYVQQNIVSKITGGAKTIWNKVSGIFN